ncbi:hypothetical protein J8J21_21455, partial [Mycobacterium tuberculosis]|nr:hypothetical protein [Mycobacterium tuberculosis]
MAVASFIGGSILVIRRIELDRFVALARTATAAAAIALSAIVAITSAWLAGCFLVVFVLAGCLGFRVDQG